MVNSFSTWVFSATVIIVWASTTQGASSSMKNINKTNQDEDYSRKPRPHPWKREPLHDADSVTDISQKLVRLLRMVDNDSKRPSPHPCKREHGFITENIRNVNSLIKRLIEQLGNLQDLLKKMEDQNTRTEKQTIDTTRNAEDDRNVDELTRKLLEMAARIK